MCFYLALKVYILYSFFCTTFSPPGRTGSGCPRTGGAAGFGAELGERLRLHASPRTWVGGGRATGTAKLPPSSQPPVRLSLQHLIAMGQPSETSLGVGANGSPSLRAESCCQGARGGDGGG